VDGVGVGGADKTIAVGDTVAFRGSTEEYEVIGIARNGKAVFLRDGLGPLPAEADKLEIVRKGAGEVADAH